MEDVSLSGLTRENTANQGRAENEIGRLLQTLEDNRNLVVVENAEEWEDDDKQPQPAANDKFKIPGSIVSILERLDDELTRSLQHIDPHTAEYIERLGDEQALYTDILRALLYTEDLMKDEKLETSQNSANRLVMRRLEHIYFKVRTLRSLPVLSGVSLLTVPINSRLKSSLASNLQPGPTYPPVLTLPLPLVPSPSTLHNSSKPLAPISSEIAPISSALAPTSAKFISLHSTTNTTKHATCC